IANGRATMFDGPYSEYRERARQGDGEKSRRGEREKGRRGDTPIHPHAHTPNHHSPLTPNPLTAGMNSYQLSKERQKAAKNVKALELRVEEMEDWLKRIEEA